MPIWPLARVLAHRCGGTLAPENTLAGMDAARAAGCGGVEFDVMLSGSGSPVLIHDETLERTTNGRGRVAETADDVLSKLDAGGWFAERFAGERVPSLEQAAARCRALGLSANLEIKPSTGEDEATGAEVARRASRLWEDASLRPLLSSFSMRALEVAARIAPQLSRALLVGALPPDWRERCRRVGAVAVHADVRHLRRDDVRDIRRAGLWVAAYTVNEPARAERLFDWGVDCVITDRPNIVRASLPREGPEPGVRANRPGGAAP